MNRNYKVIWNASLNCFMAVAEYAKSRGKSSSTVVSSSAGVSINQTTGGMRLLRLSALSAGLVAAGFSMQSIAAPGTGSIDTADTCGTNAVRTNGTPISNLASNPAVGDVAVGCGSVAAGSNAIAIGGTATTQSSAGSTQGTQSIAIGYDAKVKGDQSIGLGANVRASGNSSIAIGGDDLNLVANGVAGSANGTENEVFNKTFVAKEFKALTGQYLVDTENNKQYISTTAGEASVAVGVMSSASGALSLAFGTRSEANVNSATALGTGAKATKAGAIALGAGSLTDGIASKVENASVNGVEFLGFVGSNAFAGTASDAGRQVSVGSVGNERQIKNLAPGQISANSTDAINGSQIYAVSSKLIDNIKAATNTAPVVYTKADGTQVYKVGTQFFDNAAGTGTAVLPANIITSVQSANGSTITATKLRNVAAGTLSTTSTDAVNGSQLNGVNTRATGNTTALGGGAAYDAVTDTYTAPTYAVFTNPSNTTIGGTGTGSNVRTVGAAITAINTAVQTPLTFAGDTAASTNVQRKLGETLNIKGGSTTTLTDGNIGVVADGTDTLTVKLNKDINLGATGSVTTGNTVTNNTGVTIKEGTKVTKVSSAGTNVTDGTNTSNYGAANATVTNGNNVTTIGAGNISVSGVNNTDPLNPVTNTIVLNGTTGQINGLTDGTLATDAATVGQVAGQVAAGNTALGESVATNLGGASVYDPVTGTVTAPKYTLNNGVNTTATTDYNNVGDALGNLDGRTTANTTNIAGLTNGTIGLVKQATNAAEITVGSTTAGTSVNFANVSGVARQLTGVANGSVAAGSADAVTGDQLNSTASSLQTVIGGNATNVGGVITATNIGGTTSNTIDGAISEVKGAATKAKTTVTQGDNIVVATTTNTDGSTNYKVATSKVLTGLTSAEYVDALNPANVTTVSAAGTNVTDGTNSANYGADGLTTTDAAGNSTILNQTGLSFNNGAGATGPSITAAGINAGNTVISGLTAGTAATDAATVGQVNAAAAGSVQYALNGDNTVNYNQVNLRGTPAVLGVNADGKSIVVSGGTTLSNVANGAIASDAVNKGQLDSAISANITDVVVKDENGADITVNVTEQVVNTNLNNSNSNSLFLTYDVAGQEVTDRLTIGQTVQKMNTEGVKFAHTNGVALPAPGVSTNDSSAGAENSTAIGVNAIVEADAKSTIALGHDTLAKDTATNSVVIGFGSQVSGTSSIAIGNSSQANGNQSIAMGNGSQANGIQSIAIGTGNIVNGNNSGAFGDPNTINGNDSYAVGNNNTVNSNDTFVLGNNVTAAVNGSVVLGTGSTATTGSGVAGYGSVGNAAILATTSTAGAVAVGNGTNIFRQITGVAAGTQDSDAVNVSQLKAINTSLTNANQALSNAAVQYDNPENKGQITLGGVNGTTITNVKAGAVSSTSSEAINGAQLNAANTIVANALGGGSKVDDKGNVTAPTYEIAGDKYNDVGSALKAADVASLTRFDSVNNRIDEAFGYTNDRIDSVERQANAGIAAALSLESAPYIPGKFTYSIGAGYHRGENAIGGSLRRTADSGRWSITGGVATDSEGGASGRIGLSGVIN